MGAWWQSIWDATAQEFSDLPTKAEAARAFLRLGLAAVLGGALGFEREFSGKSAGLRTHMLVALGSALFVMVPQRMGASEADLTRVLQGLVAGVGFLGAGAIVQSGDHTRTKGLTTAAGIWITAAIGMAAGLGRGTTALMTTALALIILALLPKSVAKLNGKNGDHAPTPSAEPPTS